jgi:beta-lactamase regulating signal transducer with metallopeptidase domain/tetratricopeptide (TPR) repeat protein
MIRWWWELLTLAPPALPLGAVLIRISIVGAIGTLALMLMPRLSAANRHLVATAALAAMLVLPALSFIAPAWTWRVLPQRTPVATRATWVVPATPVVPANVTAPARVATIGVGATLVPVPAIQPMLAASAALPPARWPIQTVLVAVWLLGAALLVARLAVSCAAARAIVATSRPIDSGRLQLILDRARERMGIEQTIWLASTSRMDSPALIGWVDPTLVLPPGAERWESARLEAVFLHELGHVQRRDGLATLLAGYAVSVFWFHPLAWYLARIARRECERACDDLVLLGGVRPTEYASHLVAIASGARRSDAFAPGTLAFSVRSHLERRVASIVDGGVRRARASRGSRLVAAAVAALLVLPVATVQLAAARGASTHLASSKHGTSDGRTGSEWYSAAHELYRDEHYAAAATAYENAASLGYRVETALYNAACSYALSNQGDLALKALGRSIDAGFDEPKMIASDSDFDLVRSDPRFASLVQRAMNTPAGEAERLQAKAEYDALVQNDESDSGPWNSAGVDLMRAGDHDRAVLAFERAIRIDGNKSALYNLGCAYALHGDKDLAFDMLQRAIIEGAGDPKTDSDLNSLHADPRFAQLVQLDQDLSLYGGKGFNDDNTSEWKRELPRFERVTHEHPKIGRAWFNLGFARLRIDDPRGAQASFRRALELGYRPHTTFYNLACCSAQLGDNDTAFMWLEMATRAGFDVGNYAAHDDDLDPLRHDDRFKPYLDHAKMVSAEKHKKDKADKD